MRAFEGHDIVCVSVMDWDHPFQSSRHHLMRQLAQKNRVLFVDNQFNPVTVIKRLGEPPMRQKLATWAKAAPNPWQAEGNLWVFNPPPVVPMGKLKDRGVFEAVYAYNQGRLRESVRKASARLGFKNPILWISFNVLSSESLIGALDERMVVYHCTDEITAMAGMSPFAGEIEKRLLARADVTFTSSRQLLADKGPLAQRCHFVPNGADTELFERALEDSTAVHPSLTGLEGPIVGFAGHMEERFDFDLIDALAAAHPEWNLVLAGPVAESRREAADKLAQRPNVKFVGLLERQALPGFLKGVDVALIPFVRSAQTRAIYPLKLNEYLAAGKPVVLTPFADLREFEGLVAVAPDADGFGRAIETILSTDSAEHRARRVAAARANNWAGRAAQMESLLFETLAETEIQAKSA